MTPLAVPRLQGGSRLLRPLMSLGRGAIGLLLSLLAAALALGWLPPTILGTLDNAIYDIRLRQTHAAPEPRVVIIDIDEASIARVGRWPWDRARIGDLVEALVDRAGARVVGIDIVFAEPQAEPGQDEALASRLAGRPVVLGYYFTSDRGGRTSGALPAPVLEGSALTGLGLSVTRWDGFAANLAALHRQAAASGFFNPMIDADGKVRAVPLLAEYRAGLYESLAVAVLRQWLGSARLRVDGDQLSLRGERGLIQLPLSYGLSALVPFAGRVSPEPGARRFEVLSAGDVIEGRFDPERIRDRIVLIGSSAPGLTDLRATPVRAALPGVEVHATLIAGAIASMDSGLQGSVQLRSRSDASAMLGGLIALLTGVALSLLLPRYGALGGLTLCAVAALSVWGSAAIAWTNLGLVMPIAASYLLIVALLILNLSAGYAVEGRTRREVASLFGEYVSPALVDRMVQDPKRFSLSGSEDRELSILFVDIRGFTRIGETMTPNALREYINTFLTAMTEVIHRHGGTVDKYIGDAVMAFWGAPVDDPSHADHAVSAALAMLEEVERLNPQLRVRGLPPLRIGIGVNTGVVRVGDMGSRIRRTYTVIGDAVNLAARFEALTKRYDQPLIVGELTATQASGHRFFALDRARVEGRNEPVLVFAPVEVPSRQRVPAYARPLASPKGSAPAAAKPVQPEVSDAAARARL